MREVHGESGSAYGSPRVTAELKEKGLAVNEKCVARVMRAFSITGIRLRRRVRTTVPEPAAPLVPDLPCMRDNDGEPAATADADLVHELMAERARIDQMIEDLQHSRSLLDDVIDAASAGSTAP
ncbi:transposase [Streptomyces sp. NBC_00151]|nr:transposase [Streptomyces sp. NBC_00151]WRZ44956.1 transposase [Streptomyces sp. NBC_00151]WRZ45538.1 transposase [Streptomyces sp. NBC_00151]